MNSDRDGARPRACEAARMASTSSCWVGVVLDKACFRCGRIDRVHCNTIGCSAGAAAPGTPAQITRNARQRGRLSLPSAGEVPERAAALSGARELFTSAHVSPTPDHPSPSSTDARGSVAPGTPRQGKGGERGAIGNREWAMAGTAGVRAQPRAESIRVLPLNRMIAHTPAG